MASTTITAITLLGGIGALPEEAAVSADGADTVTAAVEHVPLTPRSTSTPATSEREVARADRSDGAAQAAQSASTALPADSGSDRRVVFDISAQRVWLVTAGERTARTYLVSGSLTDNLEPGSYEVYSRSRWATGIDDSGVMEYFVRFTRGENAAIGFHSIPTKDGKALQTRDDLGTPQSHGCIRQAMPDAVRLWQFAPVGTKVVVTA